MAREQTPYVSAAEEPGSDRMDSDCDDSSRGSRSTAENAGWNSFVNRVLCAQEALQGESVERVRDELDRLEEHDRPYLDALARVISEISGREPDNVWERAVHAVFLVLATAKSLEFAHYPTHRSWVFDPSELRNELWIKISVRLRSGRPLKFSCAADAWRYLNTCASNCANDMRQKGAKVPLAEDDEMINRARPVSGGRPLKSRTK